MHLDHEFREELGSTVIPVAAASSITLAIARCTRCSVLVSIAYCASCARSHVLAVRVLIASSGGRLAISVLACCSSSRLTICILVSCSRVLSVLIARSRVLAVGCLVGVLGTRACSGLTIGILAICILAICILAVGILVGILIGILVGISVSISVSILSTTVASPSITITILVCVAILIHISVSISVARTSSRLSGWVYSCGNQSYNTSQPDPSSDTKPEEGSDMWERIWENNAPEIALAPSLPPAAPAAWLAAMAAGKSCWFWRIWAWIPSSVWAVSTAGEAVSLCTLPTGTIVLYWKCSKERTIVEGREGLTSSRRVLTTLPICLLDCEATTEGTGDSVVTASHSADITRRRCNSGQ